MKDKKKNQLTKVNKVNSDNGFKESSIIRKTNHRFLTLLFLASIVIILIFLVAAIIDIYQFGYSFHPYVGYALLAIIILLLLIFVVRPICQALMTPCFTLDIAKQDVKKVNNINYRKLKKVAKNLLDNDNISQESKDKITEALKSDRKKLSETLKDIYQHEIKGDITKLTIRRSAETLIATAISQNNKFDALTTIVLNIRLIMQIVVRCGYHPTYPQLAKLIIKVMRNALIAYTLQSLHIEDIIVGGINKLVKGALTIIPGVNEIAKSLTQGAANALLTLRIGILTRKYLYQEYSLQEEINYSLDEELLKSSVEEADKDIDIVLNECKKAKA